MKKFIGACLLVFVASNASAATVHGAVYHGAKATVKAVAKSVKATAKYLHL